MQLLRIPTACRAAFCTVFCSLAPRRIKTLVSDKNPGQCRSVCKMFFQFLQQQKETACNYLSARRLKLLLRNSASVTLQLEAVVWEQRVMSPEHEGWGEAASLSFAALFSSRPLMEKVWEVGREEATGVTEVHIVVAEAAWTPLK